MEEPRESRLKWKNTGVLGRERPDEGGRVRGGSLKEVVMKLNPGLGE